MFQAKNKLRGDSDPESLKQMNLLKVRQVRELRKDVSRREDAEHKFLRSIKSVPETSVADLEDLRKQFHRLEDEFTLKELHAKEQRLQGAETLVQEKAGASSKKASKIAQDLIKEQVKIERDFEYSLLKQISALKKQKVGQDMTEAQYSFVPKESVIKVVEKSFRGQKHAMEQLKKDLIKYKDVDLAVVDFQREPPPEEPSQQEIQNVSKANEDLTAEVKLLTKTLKMERRESVKLRDRVIESEEHQAEISTEVSDLEAREKPLHGEHKILEEKERQVEELLARIDLLQKNMAEQEEEYPELLEEQQKLQEKLGAEPLDPEKISTLHEAITAKKEALLKSEHRLKTLAAEKYDLTQEQRHMKAILETVEQNQPEVKNQTTLNTLKELKNESRELTRTLLKVQEAEKRAYADRALKFKTRDDLKTSLRSESGRLENRSLESRRFLCNLQKSVENLQTLKTNVRTVVDETAELKEEVQMLAQRDAAVNKEWQELQEMFKKVAKEALELRQKIK